MKKTIRNTHREPHYQTKRFKVMIMSILFILFLVGSVSAVMEWDNVRDYDEKTKTITVTNALGLGEDIAKMTLNTPLNYEVGAGYGRVAEFTINNLDDYDNVFNNLEFFDLTKDSEKFTRSFDYKYKSIIQVPDYQTVCDKKLNVNGTNENVNCRQEQIGLKDKETWIEINKEIGLLKGNITIGIFIEVKVGDRVEWIPTLFGERLTEWAEWTESLNVDIVNYYKLDNLTGVVYDMLRDDDGTDNGATRGATGIINFSYEFDGTNYVNLTDNLFDKGCVSTCTISLWVELNTSDTSTMDFFSDFNTTPDLQGITMRQSVGTTFITYVYPNDFRLTIVNAFGGNGWYHIAWVLGSGNYTVYINGTVAGTLISGDIGDSGTAGVQFATQPGTSGAFDGKMDEIGIWNRTLNSTEVTQLYNSGTGITFVSFAPTAPTITLNSPVDTFNSTSQTINFNGTAISPDGIINVTLFIDDVLSETNSSGINDTDYLFTKTISDGDHNWTYQACNVGGCNNATVRTFTIDSTNPFINITRPLSTVSYHEVNTNLTINWTVSDLNLDVCILEFEGVNRTVTCLDNSTGINITNNVNRTVIFYVNDTLGNSNSTSRSWNYTIFQHSLNYSLNTIGGNTEDFELNVTKDSSLQISIVSLVYNSSLSTATFTSGDNPIISKELDIPNPDSDTNFSFYFSFTLSDSQIINTSSKNQTVLNLAIGNCSTFSVLIYNFTLLDEENQTQLENVTIDYAFNLFDTSRTTQITNFSLSSTVNPTTVCISQNLTASSSYSLDAILQYVSSDDSYLTRFYNILNFALTNSTIPNVINIYDVVDTTATPFQLTFRDSNLVLSPNILVNVNKQYVSDNDFKTVEIPITDTNGQTILNLVRNTGIYNLIFVDINGNIVASFSKVNVFCEDFTIGECTLDLEAPSTISPAFNLSASTGISYTLSYTNSTSTATLTFSSINSTALTARIIGTTQNQFGNRSVCDSSLTSTLGTLDCNASSILLTDNYLFVDIFANGNYVATRIININPQNPLAGGLYGTNGYFIAFLILLVIIILFSDDKQVLLIMIGMGWVIILIFGLIRGTIIGAVSGGIWLLVSIITMMWKLRQEEVKR